MKLSYGLTIEQTQKLTMTPELIQAIRILQFNTQELDSFVQEELLETVAAMGKPVVVLLMAGSAIDLPWAEHNPNVKAIVDCWYPGARGGKVIAEMLFGEFSPSGKLPVRFYHGTENLPVWNIRDDYERREDIPAGSSGAGSGTAL